MSKLERVDKEVGSGDTIVTAGAYKDNEGNTRYKFGMKVSLPVASMDEELKGKIFNVGLHRIMSVKAAGIFNRANEYGSAEDAKAFAEQFSSVEGWAEALEKARREGAAVRVSGPETLAIARVAFMLKKKHAEPGALEAVKVPIPRLVDPPLTEKGKVNFNAWAKVLREAEHPWYGVALKQVTQEKGFD